MSSSPLTPDLRRLFGFYGDVQRCDAKRPCTPCVENGKPECVYDQSHLLQRGAKKSRPTGTTRSPPSDYSELSPCGSSFSQLTSEDLSIFNQTLVLSDTSGSSSSSSSTNSTPSPVSPRACRIPESRPTSEFGPRTPREGSVSEVVLFGEAVPEPHNYTFAAASFFPSHSFVRFPPIFRGLQIPLSLLDPELLRVSDATPSEMNLSLYVFSISRHSHTLCILKVIHTAV